MKAITKSRKAGTFVLTGGSDGACLPAATTEGDAVPVEVKAGHLTKRFGRQAS